MLKLHFIWFDFLCNSFLTDHKFLILQVCLQYAPQIKNYHLWKKCLTVSSLKAVYFFKVELKILFIKINWIYLFLDLPWYAPLCPKFFHPLPKYDRLKSFAKIRRLEIEVRQTAEPDINEEYSKYSPRKSFQEWGARINHALKNSTRIPGLFFYLIKVNCQFNCQFFRLDNLRLCGILLETLGTPSGETCLFKNWNHNLSKLFA